MRVFILFVATFGVFLNVRAFNFTTSTPRQCEDLQVSWTGGQPPFTLAILPLGSSQAIYSLNSSTFSNGVGSFRTQLALPKDEQFVAVMSDATGFASGGTSALLTVQAPTTTINCNVTLVRPDFFFTLDNAVQQCRPFTFSEYSNATQPVTIYGVVPGGTAVVLNAPTGAQFVWDAAVPAGTPIVFFMNDSLNRTGGVSNIYVSGTTGDSSCLNSGSASVTSAGTSSTASTPSGSASSQPSSGSTKLSTAALAGIAACGVVALIGLATLVLCLRRRNRGNPKLPSHPIELDPEDNYRASPMHYPTVAPFPPPPNHMATPYEMTPMLSTSPLLPPGAHAISQRTSFSSSSTPPPSARMSDTTASGPQSTPRVIVHTDVDERLIEEREVIELPPRYEENRRPLPFDVNSSSAPSSSSRSKKMRS